MVDIKKLMDDIEEEFEGASHYADVACEWRKQDPSIADKYANMAMQELSHAEENEKRGMMMIENEPDKKENYKPMWESVMQHNAKRIERMKNRIMGK